MFFLLFVTLFAQKTVVKKKIQQDENSKNQQTKSKCDRSKHQLFDMCGLYCGIMVGWHGWGVEQGRKHELVSMLVSYQFVNSLLEGTVNCRSLNKAICPLLTSEII